MADTWVRYNQTGKYWEYSTDLGVIWNPLQEDGLHAKSDYINGSDPPNPVAGNTRLYTKADNRFYCRNSAGTRLGPFPYTEGCRIFNSANQAVASGAWTAITHNSERYDTDSMHSTVSNTSRITIQTAGKYALFGCLAWAASALGKIRGSAIMLNGTTFIVVHALSVAWDVANAVVLPVSTVYDLAINDYIELMGFQDTGGNLNSVTAANYVPEFSAQRIG